MITDSRYGENPTRHSLAGTANVFAKTKSLVGYRKKGGNAMKEDKIRILMYRPQEDVEEMVIDNDLEALHDAVGGYIECISPFSDMDVDLVCNEEGKLMGLRPNRVLMDKKTKQRYDLLVGNFFLVSFDDEGNFKSLTDEQIDKIKSEFRVTISAVWFQ